MNGRELFVSTALAALAAAVGGAELVPATNAVLAAAAAPGGGKCATRFSKQ